jgi:sugar phosphate isomerase/epimerase
MTIQSVATANFYFMPFDETVDLIAEAGFQFAELDLYWEGGKWSMAQHLKGVTARQAVDAVHRAGLRVSSIHDGGGMLEAPDSCRGYINPMLDEFLDQPGYAPECIVFHTPHIQGFLDSMWWQQLSDRIVQALEAYRSRCRFVTIENMPPIEGYSVPLLTPQALAHFARQNHLGVTIDTTHYAQMGVDIVEAAQVLKGLARSVHLSDFIDGRSHVLIGEGGLDLAGFIRAIDKSGVSIVTLECSLVNSVYGDRAEILSRLKLAKERMELWLS